MDLRLTLRLLILLLSLIAPATASAATTVSLEVPPAQALVPMTIAATVVSDDPELRTIDAYARTDDGRACEPTLRDFTDAPANQLASAYVNLVLGRSLVPGQSRYEARFTPWAEHRPALRICAYANAGLTWDTRGRADVVAPVGAGITAPGACPAGIPLPYAPRVEIPARVVVGRAFTVRSTVPGIVAEVVGPGGATGTPDDGDWRLALAAPGPTTVTVRFRPSPEAVCTLDATATTTAVIGAPLRLGKRRSLGHLAADKRGRLIVPLKDGFATSDFAAPDACRAAPLTVTLRYRLGLRRAPTKRSRTVVATSADGCDGSPVTARGKGARVLIRGLGARIGHRKSMRAWVQIRHGDVLLQEARYAVLRRRGATVALSEPSFRKARCGKRPKALRKWALPRCP